jgi:hypothetical protein
MDTRPRLSPAYSNFRRLVSVPASVLLLAGLATSARSASGDTELVSAGPNGQAFGVYDESGSVSANGRYVLFSASPTTFLPGDHNEQQDLFVHDRQGGVVDWVNVTPSGAQANDPAVHGAISGDGRFVAFASSATNLIAGDTNGQDDIFVRDRWSGVTKRVSVNSNGSQANSFSDYLAISADGCYVAFRSDASNLVPGDTNAQMDIFVHDCQTGVTDRVNVSSSEAQQTEFVGLLSISGDGRYVAFESGDIFVRDRQDGVTTRVSVNSQGTAGNDTSTSPSISANGRFVAFESMASNLVPSDTNGRQDIFVRDRQSGLTKRMSISWNGVQANDGSLSPSISADGRRVTFTSFASNLVVHDANRDGDVFMRDRVSGTTERVSVRAGGAEANDRSLHSMLSANGRFVTFLSFATNLSSNDLNDTQDVYIHQLAAPTPPPTSALRVLPRQLDFGAQLQNTTSAPKAITVTNTSTAAVAITEVRIRGNNPAQFSRKHNCGSSLAAGTSCTVNVVFKPTSLGAKSAYLLVNGGGSGLRAVYLTGTGVQ